MIVFKLLKYKFATNDNQSMKFSSILSLGVHIIFMILIVFSISCVSDDETAVEDTNDTYLDYRIIYNSDIDQTLVAAIFRKNNPLGDEVILTLDESLTFNGHPLEYEEAIPEYDFEPVPGYIKRFDGRMVSGEFVFTSSEGITYKNALVPTNTIDFESSFVSFSKNEDLIITWEGEALQENESVIIFIGIVDEGVLVGGSVDTEGADSFIITKDELVNFPLGTWPAEIQRTTYNGLLEETRAGGRIVTKFNGRMVDLEVTD